MNDKLNFNVKLSLKDYRSFYYSNLFKNGYGFILIYLSIIFFIIAPLYFIFSFTTPGSTLKLKDFKNLFIGIAVFLFILYLHPVLIFFQTKKIFNNDEFLKEEHCFTISNEAININSSSSHSIINWEKINKIIEFKKLFAIFIAPNKAFIIPKYIIKDNLNIIRKIFNENLDKKKLKIKKIVL